MAHPGLALHPDLRYPFELLDRPAAARVAGAQRRRCVVCQRRLVVQPGLTVGLADVAVVDETLDVQPTVGLLQQLQGVDGGRQRLAVFGFPGLVAGLQAERTVEQVIDLGLDAGDLLDQLAVFLRFGGQQSIGFDARPQVGHHHLRIALGVGGVHQRAMEGRRVGLGTVVDLAGEAAIGEQLGEGYEVGMGGNLVRLQGRTGDFRRLGDDGHVALRVPALRRHRAQQHAMGGGGERYGDGLAFQFGQRLHRRAARYHDAVAAATGAAGQHADEQAALAGGGEGHAVEGAGKVGHGAEVELAGDHLVGQRCATGEVLPLHPVVRILVAAVARQVFLQQAQLADQQPAGGAVDGGVLSADGHADGFRLGTQGSQGQRQAGQDCTQSHGDSPRIMVMGIVSATRTVVGNEGCFRVASGSGRMAGSASLAGSGRQRSR
ncbi:Uncharacterised protein [Acinetobacter baumannii]|nr:Uncharacterised protein [Acinetobacter baumannii]